MKQAGIRKKVEKIIEKYSVFGAVSDVWLSMDAMATLDPRPPLARILEHPYKIDEVFVTAFSQLEDDEFRLAFVNNFGVLDESSSGN